MGSDCRNVGRSVPNVNRRVRAFVVLASQFDVNSKVDANWIQHVSIDYRLLTFTIDEAKLFVFL